MTAAARRGGPARGSTGWLVLGATTGLALAVIGLVRERAALDTLGAADVARVNGVAIRKEDYLRALAGLAGDRRNGLDPELKKRLLDRMIDEELLVQRALALGLTASDPRVRKDLTAAVIDAVVAPAGDVAPSAGELAAFYADERAFFAPPAQLRVRVLFFHHHADRGDARKRAAEAVARLRAGQSLDAVAAALTDPELSPVPDVPLPAAKLLDYLGASAAQVAQTLAPGEVSDPVVSATGVRVLVLVERRDAELPPLTQVEAEVRAEYGRRSAERALRDYLAELREDARVRTRAELP